MHFFEGLGDAVLKNRLVGCKLCQHFLGCEGTGLRLKAPNTKEYIEGFSDFFSRRKATEDELLRAA